jgi:hypothetical protein
MNQGVVPMSDGMLQFIAVLEISVLISTAVGHFIVPGDPRLTLATLREALRSYETEDSSISN